MKKFTLLKTLLAVALLCVGQNAWGDPATAFSADFTDKSSTDPSDYGFNVTYGSGSSSSLVNFTVTGGVLQCVAGPYANSTDGNRTGTATATFSSIGAGNEVTVSYVWALGSATGNASGSYTKTRIGNSSGNALELSFYGSDNNGTLKVNGTAVKTGNSGIRETTYTVNATLNMNTQKITALTLTNSNSSFNYTASEAIAFQSAITSVDRFAFENSERQKWSNTSSVDNINITYTEAREAVESLVVNYKSGGTLIASENIDVTGLYCGDSYTVPFRMYVSKDGALYKTTANDSNPYYGDAITLTKNTVVNKSLSAVDLNGGTLELLEDLDDTGGENADIRASYRSAYNNKAYTSAVTLSPGIYTFIVRALNKGRGSSIAVGGTTVTGIGDIVAKNSWGDKTFTNVAIPVAGNVTLVKGGSNTIDCYDIIIAIRTGDYTVSGTITEAGWSTFSSSYPLDLSTISGGSAYYASAASGSTVTLIRTTATVPAGEGIMVKGTAGDPFTIGVAASGTAIDGNLLKGQTTTGNVAASAGGTNHYVFGYKTSDATEYGFYNLASDTSVPAGKAYLETTTGGARALTIVFDDVDGINDVKREAISNNRFYNLSGQEVAQPTKGLYIVNGKKVIIK